MLDRYQAPVRHARTQFPSTRVAKLIFKKNIAERAAKGDKCMQIRLVRGVPLLVVAALLQAPASAQGEDGPERLLNERILQESYAGVVVDQTVTVVGHDFYQEFAALWREKEASSRYAITVVERPSARWGSQLWIEYAHRRVFQVFLPAARANVRAMGEEAANVAYQNVVDTEVQRLLFREPDLGPDEI